MRRGTDPPVGQNQDEMRSVGHQMGPRWVLRHYTASPMIGDGARRVAQLRRSVRSLNVLVLACGLLGWLLTPF